MNPSNNYKPFMAYLLPSEYSRLKKLSKATRTPMAQLIREAVAARLSENQYNTGFNDGLDRAVSAIHAMEMSAMRFPSGKSVGELIEDGLSGLYIREVKNETNGES